MVNYSVSGTATSSSDYAVLSGSVTIPDGFTSATINITVVNDTLAEGDETVILTLSSSTPYFVGSLNSATLTIIDNDSTIAVVAIDASAAEQGTDSGTFLFMRNVTSGPLTVSYTVEGTATGNSDYTLLSGQVTFVDGANTATVTLTPIDDALAENPIVAETVVLSLSSAANYAIGTPSSATVLIADNEVAYVQTFSSSPSGWAGTGNISGGNSYGYSSGTNQAGGTTGEVGGTFARSTVESSFGDTNLADLNGASAGKLDLGNVISASGLFEVLNVSTFDGEFFIGHYSSSTGGTSRQFIGIEIIGQDTNTVLVRARMYMPGGDSTTGAMSRTALLPVGGNYHFVYYYDPAFEADSAHSGTEGQLAVRIFNDSLSFDQTLSVTLTGTQRDSGASFDAFGMGTAAGAAASSDPSKTAQASIDNVSYSGLQTLPTVSIAATDANAAEQSQGTGTFTVSRSGTSGDLVINFLVSGTAVNGSDYAALNGSVTIPNGQSSATITLTPVDDAFAEGTETAILTLANSANYYIVSSGSATVTIADNDAASSAQSASSSPVDRTGAGSSSPGNKSTKHAGSDKGEIYERSHAPSKTTIGSPSRSQILKSRHAKSAAGRFDFSNVSTDFGQLFVGHYFTSTAKRKRESRGIERLTEESASRFDNWNI